MSGDGHVPVLLDEVLAALAPEAGDLVIDGTFGGGGYTRALLATDGVRVVGLDRDPDAVARGRALEAQSGGRFSMVETAFSRLDEVAAGLDSAVAGVVLDIGVSSFQIDEAERGFAFTRDGPLDMRMGAGGPTAADALARLSEAELAAVFFGYGEEREARRIARAIVADRDAEPFVGTAQLAGLVSRVAGRGHRDVIHPATRVFQALRIFVNDELGELARALSAAEAVLAPGGRLVVVSFHSLEDRIVKDFLVERTRAEAGSRHAPVAAGPAASFAALTRKPVVPGEAELARNPRSRSAKLRAARRTAAPDRPARLERPPGVPALDDLARAVARGPARGRQA